MQTDYVHKFAKQLVRSVGLDGGRPLEGTAAQSLDDDGFIARLTSAALGCLERPSALATNVRLLEDGKEVPRADWSASRVGDGQVIHSELRWPYVDNEILQGRLLVVDSVDETDPTIMRLRESLEYQLNARAWVNLYLTAGTSSSFGVHSDTHDTIILQLVGKKNWLVAPYPTNEAPTAVAMCPYELSPGDLLAMSGRTFHDVTPLGELTMHLTIGFDRSAALGFNTEMVDLLFGRSSHRPSAEELEHGKLMISERRPGSSLPFAATRAAEHFGSVRLASRFPPKVSFLEGGEIELTCLAQKFLAPKSLQELVVELAAGSELSRSEVFANADLPEDVVLREIGALVDSGALIVRPQ